MDRIIVGAVTLLAIGGIVAGATTADAEAAKTNCGPGPGGGLDVKARNVSCGKAQKVAAAAWEDPSCITDGCRVLRFRCIGKANTIEGGKIVCKRGDKRVSFFYGGKRKALDAMSKVGAPDGYRNARGAERRKMRRAAENAPYPVGGFYGFFVGKRDPSFGFVCGYSSGSAKGVGLRQRNGRWRYWKNATSGDLQTYDLRCNELAGNR